MAYVLGRAISTAWISDELNPEVKYQIRFISDSKHQEIIKKHMVKELIDDMDSYFLDVLDFCLIDWNDQVINSKNKKVQCTRQAKKILMDSDEAARKWICTNAGWRPNFSNDEIIKAKLVAPLSGASGSNGGQTIGEEAARSA